MEMLIQRLLLVSLTLAWVCIPALYSYWQPFSEARSIAHNIKFIERSRTDSIAWHDSASGPWLNCRKCNTLYNYYIMCSVVCTFSGVFQTFPLNSAPSWHECYFWHSNNAHPVFITIYYRYLEQVCWKNHLAKTYRDRYNEHPTAIICQLARKNHSKFAKKISRYHVSLKRMRRTFPERRDRIRFADSAHWVTALVKYW